MHSESSMSTQGTSLSRGVLGNTPWKILAFTASEITGDAFISINPFKTYYNMI